MRKMNKIMIVDDDPVQIFTVEEILKEAGGKYELISANSGRDCLQLLKNKKIPDLILLDIMMPGMNGWDVFAKVKENPKWREIPIVFLTAQTDPYSEGFGKISADEYIEKPFDMEELKKRIGKVLQRK